MTQDSSDKTKVLSHKEQAALARDQRLKAALRANLQRRKAKTRALGANDDAGDSANNNKS